MRNLLILLSAAALLSGSALAVEPGPSPLAAGKPAGLRTAQDRDDNTIFYIVGLGAVAAGIALIASGNSDNSGNRSTPPNTAPSTQ
jgi:hypothetical protein